MSESWKCGHCGATVALEDWPHDVCPRCLLAQSYGSVEDGPPATTKSAALGGADAAGERIGPYRIVQKLGEGGMGEVFLAEQLEPVRRKVALKIIKHGMDTRHVVARFEAERQALALMNHPAVAQVLDAGATPEGRPFFAMECVPGLPITEHCDRQRLTVRERIGLFAQVCDGVQHAHQKAIIHRDLKPSNILVEIRDGVASPKIIDFGVAKATAQPLTEKTLFTEAGMLVGTPEYMSPEQADLTSQDVDTRTDVYSLGVLLYELLIGALPFESKEIRAAGYEGIRRMIREVEPPRPSTKLDTIGAERSTDSARMRRVDVPTLRRQLSGDLDWIVMKALEKDRGRRYGSPVELAADLGRHLRNEPVLAGPPGTAYRAGKFVRRHRFGVVVAVAGAVLLVAFSVAMMAQTRRTAREAEAKGRVADFLQELFRVSDPDEGRGRNVTARELLDQGAVKIRDALDDDPAVRADLLATMGGAYLGLGLYVEAEPLVAEALEIRRRVLGEEDPRTLVAEQQIGRLLRLLGRYREAEAILQTTVERQRRVLGPEHPDTLASANDLAVLYIEQGRYPEAEEKHREILEIRKRVLGPEDPDTLFSMANLANVYWKRSRFAEAEAIHREVLELRKRVLGPEHPDTTESMNDLALQYFEQGRTAEAQAGWAEVLEVRKRVLGPEHPQTLNSMGNLMNTYVAQSRYAEAEVGYREALEIRKRVLGLEHPGTLMAMGNLANAVLLQGRSAEAEALDLEILEMSKRVLGPEHPITLGAMNGLGLAIAVQGRYEEAETAWREVLELSERENSPSFSGRPRLLYNLGCVAALQGDRSGALGYLAELVKSGDVCPCEMETDSDLDSLRGTPEFEAILAKDRENRKREAAAN